MHKKSGEGGSRGLSEAQKLFMGDFDYYSLSTDYMSDEQMQEWLVIKHIHWELVMDKRAGEQILAIEILPAEWRCTRDRGEGKMAGVEPSYSFLWFSYKKVEILFIVICS